MSAFASKDERLFGVAQASRLLFRASRPERFMAPAQKERGLESVASTSRCVVPPCWSKTAAPQSCRSALSGEDAGNGRPEAGATLSATAVRSRNLFVSANALCRA